MAGTGKIIYQMRTGSLIDWKTVTGHATDHLTKGTPVELVASMPEATQFMKLMLTSSAQGNVDSGMLLDVLVDSGGGNVVKVPNIACGFIIDGSASLARPGRLYGFPIAIPSGARVLVQVATLVDADIVKVAADFYGALPGPDPADAIDTLGANTTTLRGIQLTGGLANVEGLWTEVEDATLNVYRALAVSLAGAATMSTGNYLLDVGAGELGFEVALVSDIHILTTTSEDLSTPFGDTGVLPLENELAAGSRVVARIQSTLSANSDISVIVHGIK